MALRMVRDAKFLKGIIMAGGIQVGTEAGSIESKELDGNVKMVAEAISKLKTGYYYEAGHKNLTKSKNNGKIESAALPEMSNGVKLGCMPDGGMWFNGDRDMSDRALKVCFEAKHQGTEGNAIERWAKNYFLCLAVNKDVKYITFMTGAGANDGEILDDFGSTFEYCAEKLFPGNKPIFYRSPKGFTIEEIFDIMKKELNLDIHFEDIKHLIGKKNNTVNKQKMRILTDEEIEENSKQVQIEIAAENHFVASIRNPSDPLTVAWKSINSEDKFEAKEIIIDMIKEGNGNSIIATEIVEIFNQ
jgi:predicted RNA-binding protein YlqC (UPF0109 family)